MLERHSKTPAFRGVGGEDGKRREGREEEGGKIQYGKDTLDWRRYNIVDFFVIFYFLYVTKWEDRVDDLYSFLLFSVFAVLLHG